MHRPDLQIADERPMRRCFELAAKSASEGEYPYSAVITCKGQIVAETTNRVAHDRDVTHHAELMAISQAQAALGTTDLSDCTLYANFEPCALCCYAIREGRIAKIVFALRSPLMGGASRWNILGDCKLSDAMPEVFAPPPVVVPDFLAEDAEKSLRQCAPSVWAFMHARNLLGRHESKDNLPTKIEPQRGFAHMARRIMRALRRNFFDRFGRGR